MGKVCFDRSTLRVPQAQAPSAIVLERPELCVPICLRYRLEQGSHPGVTCDKSGQCPIVGWRFNLTGQDYDLCEAEFNKLPDAEKERYQRIAAPDLSVAPQSEVGVHTGAIRRGRAEPPLGAACPSPSPVSKAIVSIDIVSIAIIR